MLIEHRNVVIFLIGFATCYAMGAVMTFNLLRSVRYTVEMSLPRAAVWPYTMRAGAEMIEDAFVQSPAGVVLPGTGPVAAK